jgi:hypothetical protein
VGTRQQSILTQWNTFMSNPLPARPPKWFYRLMIGFTVIQMIPFVITIVDFIRSPLAPDVIVGSVAYRWLITLLVAPAGLVITVMVLRRTPNNIVGLCLLLWISAVLAGSRVQDSVLASLPFYQWLGLWIVPLYFPNGLAFPPRYARIIYIATSFMVICATLMLFVRPSTTTVNAVSGQSVQFSNPLYVPPLGSLLSGLNIILYLAINLNFLLIVPTMVVRYRRSDRTIRSQMKWLVWVFVTLIALWIFFQITFPQLFTTAPGQYNPIGLLAWVTLTIFVYLSPFIAIGNAILRHNLYDIDIIIRRTLIYSVLSGLLALVFFGGVTLTQALFRSATGEGSDLAIVVSTLAIAALFSPLRRRVQNTIDSRFYRRKYDAEKTLEQFAALARDEVDVEKLKAAMVGAVQETMQPKGVGVWIKE